MPRRRTLLNFPSPYATPDCRAHWREYSCPLGWHLLIETHEPPRPPAFAGRHELECAACGLILKVAEVIEPQEPAPKNCS